MMCPRNSTTHVMQNVEDNHMDLFTYTLQSIAELTIPKTYTVHTKTT